jgi:ribosomal protein S12
VRDDRHHYLPGDVTAEHHEVSLVEGGRVQELAPADFRTVDVRGEEDPHATTRLPHALRATPVRPVQPALCNV